MTTVKENMDSGKWKMSPQDKEIYDIMHSGQPLYHIFDCNGTQMPDHWQGRPRTASEAEELIKGLNENGEYRPYKMIPA